ncbi:hypothetical protein Pelo_2343 [Pelomyxa schiedti]|nr:hypothetical protein Pelo_2343 [Pelomyxa schiedti]
MRWSILMFEILGEYSRLQDFGSMHFYLILLTPENQYACPHGHDSFVKRVVSEDNFRHAGCYCLGCQKAVSEAISISDTILVLGASLSEMETKQRRHNQSHGTLNRRESSSSPRGLRKDLHGGYYDPSGAAFFTCTIISRSLVTKNTLLKLAGQAWVR